MKKYIKDMNCDEIKSLLKNNEKFANRIFNDILEDISDFYINEFLRDVPEKNLYYETSYCETIFYIKNPCAYSTIDFLTWLKNNEPITIDSERIKYLKNRICYINDYENELSFENYARLEKWIKNEVKFFTDILKTKIEQIWTLANDIDYQIEMMMNTEYYGEMYVIDNRVYIDIIGQEIV